MIARRGSKTRGTDKVVLLLGNTLVGRLGAVVLTPTSYPPLPTVPATGLLKQLVLQAEGLTGHLSEFWPKVRNSAWFGGGDPFYSRNNRYGDC